MPGRKATEASFWVHVKVDGLPFSTARPPADERHWYWHGTADRSSGRGLVWRAGKLRIAYRVAWELFYGFPLASDEELHATCDFKQCLNPTHRKKVFREPTKPLLFRRSREAREFRERLEDSNLQAFRSGVNWVCAKGHSLKASVKRKNCPACQKDRRRRRDVILSDLRWEQRLRVWGEAEGGFGRIEGKEPEPILSEPPTDTNGYHSPFTDGYLPPLDDLMSGDSEIPGFPY